VVGVCTIPCNLIMTGGGVSGDYFSAQFRCSQKIFECGGGTCSYFDEKTRSPEVSHPFSDVELEIEIGVYPLRPRVASEGKAENSYDFQVLKLEA